MYYCIIALSASNKSVRDFQKHLSKELYTIDKKKSIMRVIITNVNCPENHVNITQFKTSE